MLLAALRLNIPTVFVSGGPMEAGKTVAIEGVVHAKLDLIDAMIASANEVVTDDQLGVIERSACPTCGSCSGMFTANSMNCLTEAIGLALPGNGSTLATHAARKQLFTEAGRLVVDLARRYYEGDDESVLPRAIASRPAFENAVALDVAMGGSTNTVLHLLAAAREAELDFGVADIDAISRRVPCLSKVAPNTPEVPHGGRAPGRRHPGHPGRAEPGRAACDTDVHSVHSPTLDAVAGRLGHPRRPGHPGRGRRCSTPRPGGVRTTEPFSTDNRWSTLDTDAADGCIRDVAHAYTADGGLAILFGNLAPDGCVVKTAGVPEDRLILPRPGQGLRVAGGGGRGDPARRHRPRRRGRHPLRRPAGRSGHAGDALPHLVPQGPRAGQGLRAHHRRAVLRRHERPVDRPHLARGGQRRADRAGQRRAT